MLYHCATWEVWRCSDKHCRWLLETVPLKHLSWVNIVVKWNHRGGVCSGCCGVSQIPASKSRHLFRRLLGELVRERSRLSSLQTPNNWRKPFCLKFCPIPERTYFQWLVDMGQPPCFKAGQLWRAVPAPEDWPRPLLQAHCSSVSPLAQACLPPYSRCGFWECFLMTPPHTNLSLKVLFPGEPNLQQWLCLET